MKKLPVKTYTRTLKNGMKAVIVHKPDYVKSLFMIGIPAGGTSLYYEKDGQVHQFPSGCAHFLEHQMFRLNGQDVTPLLASMQAQSNAFTDFTQTCYYVITAGKPWEPLKTLIQFVQTLDITKESVNKEKGIILSEYDLYDSSPDSRILTSMMESLFQKHPINTEVLGSRKDIESITPEDLENFYRLYYDPSQLILVGITGSDPQEVLDYVEKIEEGYPSRIDQKPKRIVPEEPDDVAAVHKQFEMDVQRPYCALGFKLKPKGNGQENLHWDFLINLWLDGLFGVMNPDYQKWMDERIITQSCGAEADFGMDYAMVLVYSQTDKPEEFFALAKELIQNKKMPSDKVLNALKIQYISAALRSLDSFEALAADQIRGHFQGFDPLKAVEILQSIDPEDIRKAVESLDLSHVSTIQIDPMKQEDVVLDNCQEIC